MNKSRMLLVSAFLVLGMISLAQAQTTTTTTTLSTAVANTTDTQLTVASATGFTAGTTSMFVDREYMDVLAVSGTRITVRRDARGIASSHANGATVWVGPRGTGPFILTDKAGSCTATDEAYLPQINVHNANRYDCLSSAWKIVGGPITSATVYDSVTLGAAGTFIMEGTTADAFETSIDAGDPTADRTLTLPNDSGTAMISTLATNSTTAANSISGASNALVFEGATADANEISLAPADATADRTITLPDAAGTTMLSTLATNAPDAANSVYGTSANLAFEGTTADAFETFITATDPVIDTTVTIPAIASGATTLGQIEVSFIDDPGTPVATDRVFFIATKGYIVNACSQVHSVAAGGASTLQVVKDTGTTAPGAGTDLLTAAFDLNLTANTVAAKTSGDFVSLAARTLAAGDRLSVDYANAIQSTAGLVITCSLIPN